MPACDYDDTIEARVTSTIDRLVAPLATDEPAFAPQVDAWGRVTLANGLPGLAIMAAHVGLARDDEEWIDRCHTWLGTAIDAAADLGTAPGLVQGWAGLGFAVEHVRTLGIADDAEELANDVAGNVQELLRETSGLPFELALGMAGIAIYGLERMRACGDDEIARIALTRLVASVESTRETWWCHAPDPRWTDPALLARCPDGYIDLGMAHGVGGALATLVAGARVVESAEVRALVVSSLWSARDADGWPMLVGAPGLRGNGWCRGDLGVSLAAWIAARSLDDRDGQQRAIRVFETCERRWSAQSHGLCHGIAGAAHIARRLRELVGPDVTAPTNALELVFSAPVGPDIGLLNGSAGIVLALLGFADPARSSWERWLLPGL